MDYVDIYEEYPELRDLKPRRPRPRKRRKMTNGSRLLLLVLIIAAAAAVMALVMSLMSSDKVFVYDKDGEALEVNADEVQKYLDDGYYASYTDLMPIMMYAGDGTVISVRQGDADKLAERGYTADKSQAYTNMYSEDGRTLFVPNDMVDFYTKSGWYDNISDVMIKLYKSDGSTVTAPKADVAAYLEAGWTDRLLSVASLMVGPGGEEEMVFNDKVNEYLDKGWAFGRAIDPDQPMVALTFDDGPGAYTDALLSCLEENKSAATFFVLGELAGKYPETLQKAADIGCEIANHTWDHQDAKSIGASAAADSVKRTSDAVKAIIGKPTYLYRPCYGSYDQDVLKAVGLPAIMWSIDTLDWKTRNADSTYNTVMNNVYDGAIILMHDIHQPTVDAAIRLIPDLVAEGYQLVTVSELLEYRDGGAESGKVYN